jgi:uncharacterized membrane protein
MAVALLSLLGVFVSAYLYLYKLGKIGSLACGAGSCEAVQLSRWSSFLGVDVALLGLIGYLGLFGLALAGLQPGMTNRRGVAVTLLAASAAGVLFAGYLTYLELFVIHAICFWCVTSAVIITMICVLAGFDLHRTTRRAESVTDRNALTS